MTNEEIADRLRLLAEITEKGLPFQVRHDEEDAQWSAPRYAPNYYYDRASSYPGVRIAPPPPESVPLTADDVPPGSVLRWNETNYTQESLDGWSLIVAAGSEGVTHIEGDNTFGDTTWEDLMPHEIKRPGEDWKPCSKPA